MKKHEVCYYEGKSCSAIKIVSAEKEVDFSSQPALYVHDLIFLAQ